MMCSWESCHGAVGESADQDGRVGCGSCFRVVRGRGKTTQSQEDVTIIACKYSKGRDDKKVSD